MASILALQRTILLYVVLVSTTSIQAFENSTGLCKTKCKCQSNGSNMNIDCRGKGFESSLSNWPKFPTNVTTLVAIFSNNNIFRLESLPPTDSSLVVYYDNCNITELGSGIFENCKNIIHADLSYNNIKGDQLHSDVFKGPYNNTTPTPLALEHLDLSYNKIHSLNMKLFEHMPNLKSLNLKGNHFRILDIPTKKSLRTIKNLEYLNLAANNLIFLEKEIMESFEKLITLDLSDNNFDFVPNSVSVLKSLKVLILDNNPIIEFEDQTFLGLDSLEILSAKNLKRIFELKTNTFQPLKKLRKVDLSGMNITYLENEAFGDLTSVRELNLSNCNLHSLHLNVIKWSTLTDLDLTGNQFYCDCVLYNISKQLSEEVKRNKNGPYCMDFRRHLRREIYTLTNAICFDSKTIINWSGSSSFESMRLLRTTLIMLCIVLIVSTGVAMWLGYKKFVIQRRNANYPFASSIIYNPISTNT